MCLLSESKLLRVHGCVWTHWMFSSSAQLNGFTVEREKSQWKISTGRPHFTVLHVNCTADTAFSINWRSEASLCAQVFRCHFPNRIGVSVSHFGNSHNISNVFHYYCHGNMWSVIFVTTMTCWRFRSWLTFFSSKIFFN